MLLAKPKELNSFRDLKRSIYPPIPSNKYSSGETFPLVLIAAFYPRLTGDESTAPVSHMSTQDSKLQKTYCLLNLNECIVRKARSCSLLVGYAGVKFVTFMGAFCIKVIHNLQMTQGVVRGHPNSTLSNIVSCTVGDKTAGFDLQTPACV